MNQGQTSALPPPGFNPGAVVAYVDGLVQESAVRRNLFEQQADRNLNLYLGNHWQTACPDGVEQITLNRVQNAVIAQVAIQTEQPPKIVLVPRESLEPPVYYLNTQTDVQPTPQLAAFIQTMDPETYKTTPAPDGATVYPRPLNESEVQQVESAIQAGQIPAELLFGVTDRTTADAVQTVYDAKWDESDGDFYIAMNMLYNGVIGWQDLLYGWDNDTQRHEFTNPEFLQVWWDPLRDDATKADYVIYDQVLSKNAAKALYPTLSKQIDESATDGYLRPAGFSYRQPSVYLNLTFRREMIIVRTAWIRNYPYQMTEQQAIDFGRVTQADVPIPPPEQGAQPSVDINTIPLVKGAGQNEDEPANASLDSQEEPDVPGGLISGAVKAFKKMIGIKPKEDDNEDDQASVDVDDTTPAVDTDDSSSVDAGGESSQDGEAGQQSPIATRTAYYLIGPDGQPDTSQEVKPGNPNWPTRPGIRQIRILAFSLVDDRECEHADIPLIHNVNIPIPYTMFGQGEPERLAGMQRAINCILSDMVTHYHLHAQPAEMIPESVNKRLPDASQNTYTSMPGTKFIVPDEMWQQLGGKLGFVIDPPKIPGDAWQLLDLLLKLMDTESGHAEVLQGGASASWSGKTVDALQSAAKGSIGWKSRRVEFMLKQLAKLQIYSLVTRMSALDWAKYVSKYPIHILYALKERAKSLDVNISVEISSGTGVRKASDKQTDIELFQLKVLSPQTLLEGSDHDPDVELHNMVDWQKKLREAASGAQEVSPANTPPTGPAQSPLGNQPTGNMPGPGIPQMQAPTPTQQAQDAAQVQYPTPQPT